MQQGSLSRQGSFQRQPSFNFGDSLVSDSSEASSNRRFDLSRETSRSSIGGFASHLDEANEDNGKKDIRRWMTVIGAFEQPRLVYNVPMKHFEKASSAPSLMPDPSHKTLLFRNRYNLIHQRLLRMESFQVPTVAPPRNHSLQRSASTMSTPQHAYKLTPIANLLGRNGSTHLLLGLLAFTPVGSLALMDLTGTIVLDLQHARPVPENGAWFTPGMIVLVDGIYEEENSGAGHTLGGAGGVGGTIPGKFIGFSVGGPPCERRELTLGISITDNEQKSNASTGFGWVDFLGVGSERSSGTTMRRLEKTVVGRASTSGMGEGRGRILIMGQVNIDSAKTLQALKRVLGTYVSGPAEEIPALFVLFGSFVQHAAMAQSGSGGSIEYKENFNALASVLTEYPTILRAASFVFVPGDNDPWASAWSAGSATPLPRRGVPELFTSRIKRAFTTANAEGRNSKDEDLGGEAIWTTNPARVSLFGTTHEIVLFRDDMSGRLRRNAIDFEALDSKGPEEGDDRGREIHETQDMDIDEAVKSAESCVPATKAKDTSSSGLSFDTLTARKLIKTILDQGYLSPFPLPTRPVLWDYAGALQLYPLPTALVLADPEAPPFAMGYEGCHVMNPGRFVAEGKRGIAKWVEYDISIKRGKVKELAF